MNFESNTRFRSGIFELFHSFEKLCFIKFSVAGAGGCSSSNCTVTLLQRSQQFLLLIFLNCLDSKGYGSKKIANGQVRNRRTHSYIHSSRLTPVFPPEYRRSSSCETAVTLGLHKDQHMASHIEKANPNKNARCYRKVQFSMSSNLSKWFRGDSDRQDIRCPLFVNIFS